MSESPRTHNAASGTSSNATPFWVYLICGWPLALVAIGGLVGGLFGGLAFGVNLSIWKSRLPIAARLFLIPIVGAVAVLIWLGFAVGLNLLVNSA